MNKAQKERMINNYLEGDKKLINKKDIFVIVI